jgi:hypothetical protein
MAFAHAPRGIAVIITLTHTSGDHPTSPSDDSSRVPHGDNNVVTSLHFDVKARVNLSRCGFSVSIVSRRGMASRALAGKAWIIKALLAARIRHSWRPTTEVCSPTTEVCSSSLAWADVYHYLLSALQHKYLEHLE